MRDNLVHIPSLGIITEFDNLMMPIVLAYSARNVYTLVRDPEIVLSSKDMLVKRTIEIDTKAIITLNHNAGLIRPSADSVIDHINAVEEAIAAEEAPVKKRGKRNEEEEDTVSLVDLTSPMIHEIVVSRTSIEQEPVPVQTTKPYQNMVEAKADNEEALRTNLSRLARRVVLRGEAMQHLRAPSAEEVENNISDLLPDIGETSIEAINRSGLSNYEDKLRRDVAEQESKIHAIYDWFESKVINRYNKRAPVMSDLFIEEEKTIADVTISRQELISTLFKDEIIFLNKPSSKK